MKTLLYEQCELELNFRLSAEMWQIILKFIYEHAYTQYMKYVCAQHRLCVCVWTGVQRVCKHYLHNCLRMANKSKSQSFEFSTRRVIPFVIKLIGV